MEMVILDGHTLNPGDLSWAGLEKMGTLTVYDRTPSNKVTERIGDAKIVFTNKVPMTAETFDKTDIIYVGVLATGYDIVDVKAAKEKGIPVTNIPTYATNSVAQMVFAHLLEICHHVCSHDEGVKKGDWTKNPDWCFWRYPLIELAGKTMGVIGYGRIGQTVGKIAQAFGMRVIAYDSCPNRNLESETMKYVELDELFRESDVISLHCPLLDKTKGIIDRSSIEKMKNGVIIINTSRGSLVVEEDLADALDRGKVYAAGVDVVSIEPIVGNNPLLQAKNIFITPHIAWAPIESRARLLEMAINNLAAFLEGSPINVVNNVV